MISSSEGDSEPSRRPLPVPSCGLALETGRAKDVVGQGGDPLVGRGALDAHGADERAAEHDLDVAEHVLNSAPRLRLDPV